MFIRKIEQISRYCFMIEWSDGLVSQYRLSLLQKHCPCRRCEEKKQVDEQVMANRIFSVGTYAIGIEFTSGCSKGIYPYQLLRKFGGMNL